MSRRQISHDTPDPNPRAWGSTCHGWRWGFHERSASTPRTDPQWKCKWCAQMFDAPKQKEPKP